MRMQDILDMVDHFEIEYEYNMESILEPQFANSSKDYGETRARASKKEVRKCFAVSKSLTAK